MIVHGKANFVKNVTLSYMCPLIRNAWLCNIVHDPCVKSGSTTSFPGFSPTRTTERDRERPWKMLVTCLPESGRLQTNDLGEGQVSVRFVSTERRQVSAAMKLCT